MPDHGDLLKITTSAAFHLPNPKQLPLLADCNLEPYSEEDLGIYLSFSQVYIKHSNAISFPFTDKVRKVQSGETICPELLYI